MVNVDTLRDFRKDGWRGDMRDLLRARYCWDAMRKFREQRRRCYRFVNGDQWGDKVQDEDGNWVTEEELMRQAGNTPLVNNLLHGFVKSVLGVFQQQNKEPTCTARDRDEQELSQTMSTTLQYCWQLNKMNGVISPDLLREYTIGGMPVVRISPNWHTALRKYDVFIDQVEPDLFFCDPNMRDVRTWDCEILGEAHDISIGELLSAFVKTANPAEAKKKMELIKNEYKLAMDRDYMYECFHNFGVENVRRTDDFIFPQYNGRCRVIEVWTKEQKTRVRVHDRLTGRFFVIEQSEYDLEVEAENESRRQMCIQNGLDPAKGKYREAETFVDSYWYYRFLTPTGRILEEGESPYSHGSHPYVFRAYPFTDGQIHSFVGDLIDQQKYINRLISLQDYIMRMSAKGAVLVPDQAVAGPGGLDAFRNAWSKANAVIPWKWKAGMPEPKQISANSTNIGINELLATQLKMIEDISGIQGALQGKPGSSSVSGVLYQQQTQNSTIKLLDILRRFDDFLSDVAMKTVKCIQQTYDEERTFDIVGKSGKLAVYDPDKIANIEFDVAISESTTTPAYRQLGNDFYMQLMQLGVINVKQLLEFGDFPNGDELLQSIKAAEEEMENGQVPDNMSGQQLAQLQAAAQGQQVRGARDPVTPGGKMLAGQ